MAERHLASAYTVPPDADGGPPVYMMPAMGDYAVADPVDSARDTVGPEAGWDNSESATVLRVSPTGTPDANRLKRLPVLETRPGADGDPVSWWKRFTVDVLGRHSVEFQDADGHEVAARENPRMVPRPRPSDTGEPRPLMRMNPSTYRFMRPWGNGIAREFNGVHFSMADHRRDYPIMGMQPPPERRNTYRLEPSAWDAGIVDMPAEAGSYPQAVTVAPAVAPAGNRAWRL